MQILGFQFFATAVAVSHAFAHIVDFGNPVEIAGLTVASGDLLFGDCSGLLSIPPAIADRIPDAVGRMREKEDEIMAFCRSNEFSIERLRELVRDLE